MREKGPSPAAMRAANEICSVRDPQIMETAAIIDAEFAPLVEVVRQALGVIGAIQPNRLAGGIQDRIERELAAWEGK